MPRLIDTDAFLNAEVFKDFYCYHGKRKEGV